MLETSCIPRLHNITIGMASDPTVSPQHSDSALVVTQMRPALVKYFQRKCGTGEAEDLAQDVLLNVLRTASWQSTEQAKGYIFRAAVNRWRDYLRKSKTRGVNVEWSDAVESSLNEARLNEEKSPEHVLVVEQELECVASALLQLGERTRDVFLLIRLERMKQAEVAQLLGVSISTVEKELVKALAHLARCLKQQDETT
jgi:RNA polymerase sigma-70 factor (ECF subfamily)